MITLSKSGSTVTFTFDENSTYLQNGTIDVPVNSLSLILDESNMATFRKSASNDIFVSANLAEFGMSKAELEAWYKANMVGSSGGSGSGGTTPEEVQQMIDESISGLAESSAVTLEISEATSGKADTTAVTADISAAVSGKQDTLIEGRAIDITNNTISLDLPISAGTATYSVVEGKETIANGYSSHAEGANTQTRNLAEHASGRYNWSLKATNDFGHSGNTLFSVGNGAYNSGEGVLHNAIDIRQNGDIYIVDTSSSGEYFEKQMIKLQDSLGGTVSSAITSGDTNAVAGGAVYSKFDEVEQVTAAALNNLNDKFGGLKLEQITQADYDALSGDTDSNTLYVIVN